MNYVYRLRSLLFPDQVYTGLTKDVLKRFTAHNNGQFAHSSKHKPWELLNYFSFNDEKKAKAFEKYLKSGSGRAFAERHF